MPPRFTAACMQGQGTAKPVQDHVQDQSTLHRNAIDTQPTSMRLSCSHSVPIGARRADLRGATSAVKAI